MMLSSRLGPWPGSVCAPCVRGSATVIRDRSIRTLRNHTQPIPRIRLTASDTTEAIGARAAIGRTALGAERTGVAAIGATLGKVTGTIAGGLTRVVTDLAACGAPVLGRARPAALQAGMAEPTIAGLDHTAVIGSSKADPR
jgi:hypothetical protein